MAQLINRFKVHDELIKMIDEAEEQLIFISPYIKLHDDYKKALLKKVKKPELEITVVFGKNADDKSKSINMEDFEFFRQLPNIKIKYCERLHAKIYANDFCSLVTSMNLHRFSAEENIEVGILCKSTLLGSIFDVANSLSDSFFGKDTLDGQIMTFMYQIIDQYSPRVYYHRSPVWEKGILSSTYLHSKVLIDSQNFYSFNTAPKSTGFCIRTGKQIPFDVKHPFSPEAHASWSRFKKEDYPEKFCHYSGEPSNGETSFKRPVLSKNWKKPLSTSR